MGKKRVRNTFDNYRKKLKEGRGTGDGIEFLPWLTGHEFASRGAYVRMMGYTVPRMYVLLSHLESDVFRIYDHMPGVTDIKEQFPLPLPETLSIAQRLGIAHPYSDSFYNVVTTDLLILKEGVWMGRAIKQSKELEDKRTVEKLRIEQEWYHLRGLEWKIVTEREINRELVLNIRWLYEDGPDIKKLISDPAVLYCCEQVFLDLYFQEDIPFRHILEAVEDVFSLNQGAGMALFKELVRSGQVPFDMEKQFNPENPRKSLKNRGTVYGRYPSYA